MWSLYGTSSFSTALFSTWHYSEIRWLTPYNFRLILPPWVSINDSILKEDFTSFDDAVDLVHHLGKDCELGKMDIKHDFRLCPVSPFDWSLLGMFWNGAFYIDTRLPFGSRSSPYIFNTFADALAWIIFF